MENSDNATTTGKPARAARSQKTMVGKVKSDKMQKTVVVGVEKMKQHPLYHKSVRRVYTYKAHDENNECKVGDVVRIIETRPLSAEKRWRVVEILDRGSDLGPAGQI